MAGAQERQGHVTDGAWERGAEEESLPLGPRGHVVRRDDRPQLRLEPHVEHSVALVDHKRPTFTRTRARRSWCQMAVSMGGVVDACV